MFAPAAFGVRLHRCTDYPCTGNNRDNVLDERRGNGTPDKILGKGGRDVIDAHWNGRDKDIVLGNRGQDNLDVFDHDNKVPSYDRYGFAFLPTQYWRGPVWVNINWFLMRGLERYGYEEQAERLGETIISLCRDQSFYEYYDPTTGFGHGSDLFSWTAALFLDVVFEG